MSEQAGQRHFLTNHARVLVAIARDPATRLRDIAAVCRITDLCLEGTLRHPAEADVPVRELLEVFTSHESPP
ncbi:hypothetical protein OG895_42305 [Streptomyces sp. NBC_00201]|uniref:hypothetical protein n=1 Tax=unclassified Streptomyces TaxID=2593676 RepID=UPI002256EA97|nr:hypothetical protein [Streptomyces sp. NBC_00201]MCX5251712.1 hypothetical protein [Streptomyces sp. NBC_00201]